MDERWKKEPVLVHFGYSNKIPQTGWLVNNRNLLLIVLEAGSPRSRCQQVWLPLGPLSLALGGYLPTVSSHGLPHVSPVSPFVQNSSSDKDTNHFGLSLP